MTRLACLALLLFLPLIRCQDSGKTPFAALKHEALSKWEQFKTAYNREYNTSMEERRRKQAFVKSYIRVERHNALARRGQRSFEMKLNRFSDMLPSEYQKSRDLRSPSISGQASRLVRANHTSAEQRLRIKQLQVLTNSSQLNDGYEQYIDCEVQQYWLRTFTAQFLRIPIGTSWQTLAMDCSSGETPEYTVQMRRMNATSEEMAMQIKTSKWGVYLFERVNHEVFHVFVNGERLWNTTQMRKYGIRYDYLYHRLCVYSGHARICFNGYNAFISMLVDDCKKMQCAGICGECSARLAKTTPPTPIIPDNLDWREKGAVTSVKDQGACEADWAFSAAGSVEGVTALHYGGLLGISAQNLVDCAFDPFGGKDGCVGGSTDLAFVYITENIWGVDTEDGYPYEGVRGPCRYEVNTSVMPVTNVEQLPRGDEMTLKAMLAVFGPVSVTIDARHASFRLYKKGVYYEPGCSEDNVQQSLVIVGYGTDPREGDYWLLKNSWGTQWGEDGYMRIARNRNNHCGITTHAFLPRFF